MMRLIDEFAKRVLNENSSFTIHTKKDNADGVITYHFLQSAVGKGKYVYGDYDYWDDKCYSKLDLKPELVAIISDGVVCIVNEFFFDVYHLIREKETSLPGNVVSFNLTVDEKNEYLKNVAFPKFYDSLETVELNDKDFADCEKKARETILSKNPVVKYEAFDNLFSERTIAEMLCGLTKMEDEIKKHLEEEREKWIHIKSFNEKVEELIEAKAGVENWEIAIAEGLRSVEAKTVTVEFELNDKKASAKMDPDVIRRCMLNNDYFSGYEFATTKRGDELIDYLGANKWLSRGKDVLTCKHISKITYGKKELYVRK